MPSRRAGFAGGRVGQCQRAQYAAFRFLTLVLIALGMAGFEFSRLAMTRGRGALEAFAGVAGTHAVTPSARASVPSSPLPRA